MDLSQFKILKEDDDHIHIGHPNGKRLVVSKNKLSTKAHALVQKFAQGGTAKELNDTTVIPDKGWGKIIVIDDKKKEAQGLADGGSVMDAVPAEDPAALQQELEAPVTPQEAQVAAAPQLQAPPTAPQQPMQPVPQAPAVQTPAPMSPVATVLEGVQQSANAESEKSRQSVKAIDETLSKVNAMPTQEQVAKKYDDSRLVLEQKLADGTIDPNRLWKNKSTGAKVSASLGMILSGFGAGLAHQDNLAVKTLDKAIEQDIEAQKNDQNKTVSLWKMNREAYGSEAAANLATQNQYYSVLSHKLDRAAATALGPEAQARALQMKGSIQMEQQKNAAMLSFLTGAPKDESSYLQGLNGLAVTNPAAHKEAEAKYVPGVGVARVPLTPDVRKELGNYQAIGKTINEAIDFQKNVAGFGGAWTPENRAVASNLKNSLAAELNKLYGLNRLTEIEYHNFTDQIGNIGSINAGGVDAKLENLMGQLRSREKTVMDSHGITPFNGTATANGGQQQNAAAQQWLQANPNDPRAAAVRAKLGMK